MALLTQLLLLQIGWLGLAQRVVPNLPPDPARVATSTTPTFQVNSAGLPQLSSSPTSVNVLFLDFDGHAEVTGTQSSWGIFSARPFDLDGNPATFSVAEQVFIYDVFARVSEDFAPFAVDVTTIEPTELMGLSQTLLHTIITNTTQTDGTPMFRTAGVDDADISGVAAGAVMTDFGTAAMLAARISFNYVDRTRYSPAATADTVSHELGHGFGLQHHGYNDTVDPSVEYYMGELDYTNPQSWGPLMGSSFASSLSTWSTGAYQHVIRTPPLQGGQNDVAILTAALGATADNHDDTAPTNPAFSLLGGTGNPTRLVSAGTIGPGLDVDLYYIQCPVAGVLTVGADPATGSPSVSGEPTQANLNAGVQVLGKPTGVNGYSILLSDVASKNGQRLLSATGEVEIADSAQFIVRVSGLAGPEYPREVSMGRYSFWADFEAGATLPPAPPATACVADAYEPDETVFDPTVVTEAGSVTLTRSLCASERDVVIREALLLSGYCANAVLAGLDSAQLADLTFEAMGMGVGRGETNPHGSPQREVAIRNIADFPISATWVVQTESLVVPSYTLRLGTPYACTAVVFELEAAAPSPPGPPSNGAGQLAPSWLMAWSIVAVFAWLGVC